MVRKHLQMKHLGPRTQHQVIPYVENPNTENQIGSPFSSQLNFRAWRGAPWAPPVWLSPCMKYQVTHVLSCSRCCVWSHSAKRPIACGRWTLLQEMRASPWSCERNAFGTVEKGNNWRRAPWKWAVSSTQTLLRSHCAHRPDLPLASLGQETPTVEGEQLSSSACITAAAASFYLTPEWAPERSFHSRLLSK